MSTVRSLAVAVVCIACVSGCRAKPVPPQEAPYLPLLARLAASPTALPAVETKADGPTTKHFSYADPAGTGIRKLAMVVAKDRPNSWRLSFEPVSGTIELPGFEPKPDYAAKAAAETPPDWFEIGSGPLKGAVVHLPGYIGALGTPGNQCKSAEVFSPGFFLSTAFNFAEPKMMQWACDSGRGGVKAPILTKDFLEKCEAAVLGRLARPDTADYPYGLRQRVATAADCSHAWKIEVRAKNAVGVELAHNFMCVSIKAGAIELR